MFLKFRTEKNKLKLLVLTLIMIFSVSTLLGCGSSGSKQTADSIAYESGNSAPAEAYDREEPGNPAAIPGNIERKIIQTVDLSIRVDDVEAVMAKIINLTSQHEGYVVNSSIYKQEDSYRARLTVKIPRDKLTGTVNTISEYGEVTNNETYTEDVTTEYYDSQARLKVLEAKEERLLALLEKAASIPDIVTIETELGNVRSEIEVIKGRLQFLTNSTSFSTININLNQAVPGHLKAPQGTTNKAWQGLINSINNMIDFGSNLIVFLVTLLPWLVVLAMIYYGVRWIKNKRKNKNDPQ